MYWDGDIIDTGIDLGNDCTKVRVTGHANRLVGSQDKFWLKAVPICNMAAENYEDGRKCNGCTYHCGQKELFIKFYTGNEAEIIKSMENQGKNRFFSAYIAETFGYRKTDKECYVVLEYVKGDTLKELPKILEMDKKEPCTREYVLTKYKLIRQILLCVQDYQRQWGKGGEGVHLDLKPDNFIVTNCGKEHQLQIKLVDFEGYTRIDGSMKTFVCSAGYAHPEQIICFQHGNAPIQVEVAWDFYALGLIIYEMLEEKPFFTTQEVKIRNERPSSVNKDVVFRDFAKDVPDKEWKVIRDMIKKMIDLEEPWTSIEEILMEFQNMLDTCLSADDISMIKGCEYLKAEEKLLLTRPFIRIGVEICSPEYPALYQSYDLIQGSIIPWYNGINIRGSSVGVYGDLLGYLYEYDGKVYYFPIKEEHELQEIQNPLKQTDVIKIGDVEIKFVKLQNVGYSSQRALLGRRRNI